MYQIYTSIDFFAGLVSGDARVKTEPCKQCSASVAGVIDAVTRTPGSADANESLAHGHIGAHM